ncbi:MAG: chromate efflux transporter [Desulfotomaculum sp.]|nr:chromate efflux transporter [Desulfotomaculum sp.]
MRVKGESNAGDKQQVNSNTRDASLYEIGATFFRIGLVSFSLAALGEAKNWLVKEKKWFTDEEYLQGVGFSQILPGAPAVSLMTYLGYHLRGFLGAFFATAAYLTPAFLFMLFFTYLYAEYHDAAIVFSLFKGLGALVVGLVINTVLNLWKSGVNNKQNWVLAVAGFLLIYWLHLSIYWILFIAASVSTVFMLVSRRWKWWAEKMAGLTNGGITVKNNSTPFEWKKFGLILGLVSAAAGANVLVILSSQTLFQLGTTFMELGGLVFGSGYAMFPFIQEKAIDTYHWITTNQFTAALALSLVTPGPITKIAAFIGYEAAGLLGALIATVNIYLPTFCIINLTADLYRRVGQVAAIRLVVRGVVAAFIGTLWAVVIRLAGNILVDIPTWFMALGAIAAQRYTKIDTLWLVIMGAAVSIVLF